MKTPLWVFVSNCASCVAVITVGPFGEFLSPPPNRSLFDPFLAPALSPAAARKRWIAGGLSAQGTVVIDAGAERALLSGKSLLPAGVTEIKGQFERGDSVIVSNSAGRELARGLIAYNVDEARLIAGRRTVEIESILGYRGPDELIHRDDLALVSTGSGKDVTTNGHE